MKNEIINSLQLTGLISIGESETIEFKESFNDEAIETLGAFMNAKGGILLIGIKNSGTICGFDIGKKTLEDIANRTQEATEPRIQPSISTIKY
ncbi:MAG: ATP-binding protein [Burkholderiales bacterium]|nr:ATP-binding protein [Burkholderiales bacterium]